MTERIFDDAQILELHRKHRADYDWRPAEVVKAALIHDATTLGVHPEWFEVWERDGRDGRGGWDSALIVLADRAMNKNNFCTEIRETWRKPPHEAFPSLFKKGESCSKI